MSQQARFWLEKIHALGVDKKIKIMNVCGGHERSLSLAGIRTVLPDNIELIPGPGCPVCVCPEEDIHYAIALAKSENNIVLAFGDMLHVPVNTSKNTIRSLQQAKAQGADVRAISSPQEAIRIAHVNSEKRIIFFAAGFETTTAPVIALLAQGLPDNLYLLLAARRTWPAVEMLLQSGSPGFDAIIAPGHVATVMGSEEWSVIADTYQLPVAVAGFNSESLLAAIYSVLRQHREENFFLDNCYNSVATRNGNSYAKTLLDKYTHISDAMWRGIGIIPSSGFELKENYQHRDVKHQFPEIQITQHNRLGEMPPGCDCAQVVLGKIYPDQCRLYGKACNPQNPIGPCMVSDEGACRIWWTTQKIHHQKPKETAHNYA